MREATKTDLTECGTRSIEKVAPFCLFEFPAMTMGVERRRGEDMERTFPLLQECFGIRDSFFLAWRRVSNSADVRQMFGKRSTDVRQMFGRRSGEQTRNNRRNCESGNPF